MDVKEHDLVDGADQEGIHALDRQAPGAIEVLGHCDYFEVVDVLSPVNVKRLLVGLVCDAVLYLGAEHHDGAVHEVVHHVLQGRQPSLEVDQVEEDFGVSYHLDPLVAFNEEDVAALFDRVVIHPRLKAGKLIQDEAEEQNLRGRPGDKGSLIDQKHLTEILVEDPLVVFLLLELFVFKVAGVLVKYEDRHSVRLPLAVKGVDLIIL